MSRYPTTSGRVAVDVHLDAHDWQRDRAEAVRLGLTASPPWLSPVWFYDDHGSRLFDEITRLPEYYQTRAERQLLADHAADLAGRGVEILVELGSGTSDKTEVILDALADDSLRTYVPFDVSELTVRQAIDRLAERYERLRFHGVVGDFGRHLGEGPADGLRLVAFLGGTIGNLMPDERHRLLAHLRSTLHPGDLLLVGIDLIKDPARIVAAYDDSQGVTAAFNRNALCVLNRELGANFDPGAYQHVARWNADEQWIEMHLRAASPQQVAIADLGIALELAEGDEIRTEISAKFTLPALAAELHAAGYEVEHTWPSPNQDFALVLAAVT